MKPNQTNTKLNNKTKQTTTTTTNQTNNNLLLSNLFTDLFIRNLKKVHFLAICVREVTFIEIIYYNNYDAIESRLVWIE